MGKQREEYKKLKAKKSSQLDKSRIDRLNEIGFQWSVQNWTITSWDDRYQVSIPCRFRLLVECAIPHFEIFVISLPIL